MSRNFELLQQAGLGLPGSGSGGAEIPFDPSVRIKARAKGKDRVRVASLRPADLDRAAREETLRLVQSVFLLHGEGEGGRVVVFAAVDSQSGCSRRLHTCSADLGGKRARLSVPGRCELPRTISGESLWSDKS